MPELRTASKRDVRLRLALHLERQYATMPATPDALQQKAEQVLFHADRVRRLVHLRRMCQTRRWRKADSSLSMRQSAELRELQYLLGSVHQAVPQARTPVTAATLYRDLVAIDDEFDGLHVEDDLSSVSVVTDAITLEGIGLGRFRLTIDLAAMARGRRGGDCLDAEALDPNPASCNDEVTHPHVQGGQVCLGDGSHLLRAALEEGRLYDAFVVVNQVLHTYNDASPYVALDRWNGRTCDDCDDVVPEDETYGCEGCGDTLCSGCTHRCVDCDSSYCRSCLTPKDGDLLCSSCFESREASEEEEAEQDDDDELQPLTPEEAVHEQTQTP